MADILLIQPPIRDFYLTAKRTIPYGLTCIAANLIKSGFSVNILDSLSSNKSKILDLPTEMLYLEEFYGRKDLSPFSLFNRFKHFGYSFEYIGKIVKDCSPFLVGISSLFTAYSIEALKTAEIVKKIYPNCTVVMGGHHPTALPKEVIQNPFVDFIIRGEGEKSMVMLAKAIKYKLNFENIPGIVFCRKDGSIYIKYPAEIESIDNMPLPEADLVKHSFYKRKDRVGITLSATRGCQMKCSFCAFGSYNVRYRTRSVDYIIKEIEQGLKNYNTGFIDFEDENISFNKKWFIKLLNEIIRCFGKYDIELRAMNGLFPPTLDEETICAMKEAGFKTLNLSLVSCSAEQLKIFKRQDVKDSFDNVLLLAEKYGLDAVGYIIVGAPLQSAEDSILDLIYLSKKRVLAGVSVFYPCPGSAIFNKLNRLGILPDYSLMRSTCLPAVQSDRIETVTILRLGRILNFIKSLADINEEVKIPSLFYGQDNYKNLDSIEIGKKLVSCFLYDGKIRGISDNYEIFKHKISVKLTLMFIDLLEKDGDKIKIRGTK